jgi:iron complex transport system permease protein
MVSVVEQAMHAGPTPADRRLPVLHFDVLQRVDAPASDAPRDATRQMAIIIAIVALACVVIAAASIGAVRVAPLTVLGTLLSHLGLPVPWEYATQDGPLLWSIRFPRVLFGALVGATLGTAGGALQGTFRNPLADPGVIGVSAGAALAAALAIVLGGKFLDATNAIQWVPWLLPLAAFVGAGAAALIVLLVAQRSRGTSAATLLLAGIAVNALAAAGTGMITSVANDTQLRALTFWTLGSLGGATWDVVRIVTLPMLLALVVLQLNARRLDLLLLGDREAGHLGINTSRLRWVVIGSVALGVGSAVAFSGLIGFVGLVIPHFVRLIVGPSHRGVLPLSALLGATLLMLTDLLARTVMAPLELPIGAVTAVIGAPVFLSLVMRRRPGTLA